MWKGGTVEKAEMYEIMADTIVIYRGCGGLRAGGISCIRQGERRDVRSERMQIIAAGK